MEICIKKLTETAQIPMRGSDYAAGYDLYADIQEKLCVTPHNSVKIPTGLALEIPEGYFSRKRLLPWIEGSHSSGEKIDHVTRDNRHAMDKGRCRNKRITLAAFVGHVQPGTALRHGCIYGQRPFRKLWQNLLFHPCTQYSSLGGILALNR